MGQSTPLQPQTIVLIVEDEPLLRMMAVDLVEEAGFVALEAADADEAIAILEGRSDVCIVFTDVQMPGTMDGVKLAACISGRWPRIEIILTSGQVVADDVLLPARGVFIPKPYSSVHVAAVMTQFGH